MGRPATCLTEVNALVSTLTLTPHAAALVASARALAKRIDAADGAESGAVLAAVPGLTRALSEVLDEIVTLCTTNDPDPLLAYLNDDTGTVPPPPGHAVAATAWADR